MYDRQVAGQKVTLTVSGMLWKRSLVMQDVETESLWSHLLGRAMDGKLKGEELEVIPATMTDWGSWKKRHPQSTAVVLSRTSKTYQKLLHDRPGKFVLGIAGEKIERAYPFDILREKQVVNDRFEGSEIVVTYDVASANAFLREVEGHEGALTFEAASGGMMTDRQSGSSWDRQSGRCTKGKLAGAALTPLPAIPSFKKAWDDFHPKSELYKSP